MRNKTTIRSCFNISTIVLLTGIIGLLFHNDSVAETRPMGMSFQVFYDELQPYGDWIDDPIHGYVWVPYAETGFQPYATNGYWVMSTYGNTWVSNYDWGWAPFHYGRWYFDDYLGWAWVPGYEWGPAWVNWRTGGGYYGWAPLMPGLTVQVGFNIPSNYWVFVPQRRLISRNVYHYYTPRRHAYKIYNQTTIINNTYIYNNNTYVSGPARKEVERATRRSVPVYQVNDSNKPGRAAVGRTSLQVYRPSVRQTASDRRVSQPRPIRVVSSHEHKTNLESRNNARSSINNRTVPGNSRVNNSRSNEVTRSGIGATNRTEAGVQRQASPNRNNNSRVSSPSPAGRSISSQGIREAQAPARQQRTTARPATNVRQGQSAAASRAQTPQQAAANGTSRGSSRSQSVQTPRSNNPGSQEVRRSSAAPRAVAPAGARERSSESTGRTASRSRTSSRGNN